MMIVVAIIAILAGVAIPQYNKYIKKSEASEGMIYLKEFLNAEKFSQATGNSKISFVNQSASFLNNMYSISLPLNSRFKKFTVINCSNSIIVSASSDDSSMKGTIYLIDGFLTDYTTSKYSGNYYLYDYINQVETPNEAPITCRAR